MAKRPKLLFLVTEDWYFCSHRLALAIAARDQGYDVCVVTRVRRHGDIITQAGIRIISFENERRSINPIRELGVVARLLKVYLRERPDIVHHVAVKPVIYGAIAARLSGVPRIVHALAGLGWFSCSETRKARFIELGIRSAIRILLSKGVVVVQNPDDRSWLNESGVPTDRIRIIRGSGVDVQRFSPRPTSVKAPIVVLVARMLWDKGVGEFVQAAREIRKVGENARFVLVGSSDPGNPASIPECQLHKWVAEGVVEWWGTRDDIPSVLGQARIACLPSYREGLPKSLLEAAAVGLPIVTTDVPGCREVVSHEVNGLLIPPRNVPALTDALLRLLRDRDACIEMGNQGRRMAVREFSIDQVVRETLDIYRELLSG